MLSPFSFRSRVLAALFFAVFAFFPFLLLNLQFHQFVNVNHDETEGISQRVRNFSGSESHLFPIFLGWIKQQLQSDRPLLVPVLVLFRESVESDELAYLGYFFLYNFADQDAHTDCTPASQQSH